MGRENKKYRTTPRREINNNRSTCPWTSHGTIPPLVNNSSLMNSRPTPVDPPSTRTNRPRPHDYGTNDMARIHARSKVGINAPNADTSLDHYKKKNAVHSSLDELEQEFSQARSNSTPSSPRDRPWRKESPVIDYGTPTRWAAPQNYEEDSRAATSNAVVEMATRIANTVESDDVSFAPMGGTTGGVAMEDSAYVRTRLTELLSPEERSGSGRRLTHSAPAKYGDGTSERESDYDRVRTRAMKMLLLADSLETSPTQRVDGDKVTGLFRTPTGGLSMRELQDDEVSFLRTKKHISSSIAGLDRFHTKRHSEPAVKVEFGSHDEVDPHSQHSAEGEYVDAPPGRYSWSSRYSVERQLMAITGGLDSTDILNKMDMLRSSREKTKSARGMYRSSASAMDGSGEEYGDYTKEYSTAGVGMGGVWNYVKGTLWSDVIDMNYDGTTQSLVRMEKWRAKRRRVVMGMLFLLGLVIAVSVLVVKGNPKLVSSATTNYIGDTVIFYVLADEPYDLSNVRQLTEELENLPTDAEFLVHLGNANGDSESRCQEFGYERAANILKESPVPTLVLPGDRDWATCQHPQRALEWWSQNLGEFDKNFKASSKLNVEYQEGTEENFAFLFKGVLFLGVHMVGTETNPEEWTERLERNVIWTVQQLNREGYRSVVIFGHAPPSNKQGEYFWPVMDQLKDMEISVYYLHANSEGGHYQEYHPFGEAQNFVAVQLERRGREAPMKVTVWGDEDHQNEMFEFTRRASTSSIVSGDIVGDGADGKI